MYFSETIMQGKAIKGPSDNVVRTTKFRYLWNTNLFGPITRDKMLFDRWKGLGWKVK